MQAWCTLPYLLSYRSRPVLPSPAIGPINIPSVSLFSQAISDAAGSVDQCFCGLYFSALLRDFQRYLYVLL